MDYDDYWAMAAALDLHREVALPVPLHNPSITYLQKKFHTATSSSLQYKQGETKGFTLLLVLS